MAPFRVAHMQVDHRGAALEAFGGRAGEFVGAQRQRRMVGLGLAPAIGRNRQRHPSTPFGQGHRIPPFRRSPWERKVGLTHPLHNSPLLSVMTHILHRAANIEMPVAVSGCGVEIVDSAGRRYLDASGGAAVSCLGHGHPDVLAAMRAQLDALAYAHTSFFTTEAAERLADRLIEDAPPGLSLSIS